MKCVQCQHDRHEQCAGWVPTGRQVPDTDPYRERTGMVPQFVACTCGCQDVEVPF